jgi:hypothetical protein
MIDAAEAQFNISHLKKSWNQTVKKAFGKSAIICIVNISATRIVLEMTHL